MQNILVPIGISPHAQKTFEYAMALSERLELNIFVIDAYPMQIKPNQISNIKARLEEENQSRIQQMIKKLKSSKKEVKVVKSNADLLETIKKLDQRIGLDLIVVPPYSNDIDETIFLGSTAGSIIKKTDIPVWVAPIGKAFEPPKNMLLAFKSGEIKSTQILAPLLKIQDTFKTLLNLLLVKVPGFSKQNHALDDTILSRSEKLRYSENATVYQGVLEYFQSVNPDLLVVFKRERGFFEKLWESNVVYKKDFYCTIPLLVLKNKT